MFEQSLYEKEPEQAGQAPNASQAGDMFHAYELKAWDWSPRFLKLAGIVAAVNIVLMMGVAQTSLLTTKGCDSPLVGRVCQVLDTVYVGALLFGTDREYVDAEYERTELQDADITFVDVGGSNAPLSYPEGYFAVANPVEYQAMLDAQNNPTDFPAGIAPGIPYSPPPVTRPSTGSDLTATRPNYAKPNKNPVVGNLPSGINDVNDNDVATVTPGRRPRKGNTGPLGGDTGAKSEPCNEKGEINGIPGSKCDKPASDPNAPKPDEATPDANGVYLNKRPTRVFAADVLKMLEAKQITLDKSFKITIKGTLGLGKDGKTVILKNPKPVVGPENTSGDEATIKLAQQAVIAFGDAGWFGYLNLLESKNVVITLEQMDDKVVATLKADQPTEEKAAKSVSGLNLLMAGYKMAAAEGDAKTFLQAATLTSSGKTFLVNFALPKQAFNEMVQRKLAEQKAGPTPTPAPGQPGTMNISKAGENRTGE